MSALYDKTCSECSKLITNNYSTSFSLGIKCFDKKIRSPIYGIYAFVRFADEIVDTFHDHDKKTLLDRFRENTFLAIREKISLNPILESFQRVVNQYEIEDELITAFLDSMEMDLELKTCEKNIYDQYIYGSAEVVGLMCLRVFCEGSQEKYEELKASARSLGSAFQKVNFLRDMKSDFQERGRIYFPGVDYQRFSVEDKLEIEQNIKRDFDDAYKGILQLPEGARFGVYLAYIYYLNLFNKITKNTAQHILEKRIRINDGEKLFLLFKAGLRNSLNLI